MSDTAWIIVTFIVCCFLIIGYGLYLIYRDRS